MKCASGERGFEVHVYVRDDKGVLNETPLKYPATGCLPMSGPEALKCMKTLKGRGKMVFAYTDGPFDADPCPLTTTEMERIYGEQL